MDDAAFIAAVESVCFESQWTEHDIRAVIDSTDGVFEIDEGTGYALGRISFDEAELYRIAVLPEKRRAHAGSELLKRFMDSCRDRGVKKIFLEVRSRNVPAVRMYERHGFVRIAERKRYYGDDDALIFMHELTETTI